LLLVSSSLVGPSLVVALFKRNVAHFFCTRNFAHSILYELLFNDPMFLEAQSGHCPSAKPIQEVHLHIDISMIAPRHFLSHIGISTRCSVRRMTCWAAWFSH